MDTRLQSLLHDLATEMPVDIEGTGPKTLRRARRRRVLTGGAGAAIAVALVVVVSISALRFGDDPTVNRLQATLAEVATHEEEARRLLETFDFTPAQRGHVKQLIDEWERSRGRR